MHLDYELKKIFKEKMPNVSKDEKNVWEYSNWDNKKVTEIGYRKCPYFEAPKILAGQYELNFKLIYKKKVPMKFQTEWHQILDSFWFHFHSFSNKIFKIFQISFSK